jgi:hypothetical protein
VGLPNVDKLGGNYGVPPFPKHVAYLEKQNPGQSMHPGFLVVDASALTGCYVLAAGGVGGMGTAAGTWLNAGLYIASGFCEM